MGPPRRNSTRCRPLSRGFRGEKGPRYHRDEMHKRFDDQKCGFVDLLSSLKAVELINDL